MTGAVDVHLLIRAGAVLIVAGYGLLGVMMLLPGRRALALDLLRTFFSATFIAAVLIVATLIGPWAMVPLMLGVAFRAGFEAGHVGLGAGRPAWAMGGGALALALIAMAAPMADLVLIGVWLLVLARLVTVPAQPGSTALMLADLMVFPVIPLALMARGVVQPETQVLVLGAYLLVEFFDSFALLSGRLFGRTKAFPVLSPRKTIEGLAGGALALAGLCAGGAWALGVAVGPMLGVALAVGALAVAGDLAASRLKRRAGVKDYPVVMARQGGVLDSIDSWIAASAGLMALQIAAQVP